jgi:hypothetical protein
MRCFSIRMDTQKQHHSGHAECPIIPSTKTRVGNSGISHAIAECTRIGRTLPRPVPCLDGFSGTNLAFVNLWPITRSGSIFKTKFCFFNVRYPMPCPVCELQIGDADHRTCLLQLFRENRIKSTKEWKMLCKPKPKTLVKETVWKLVKTDF